MTTPPGPHLGPVLSGLLDGELTPAEAAGAQAHLAGCESCRAELAAVAAARRWLRAMPAVEPPAGYLDELTLRRFRLFTGPTARRWGAGAAAAAVLVAVGLVGAGPTEDRPVSPALDTFVEAHVTGASLGGDPLRGLVPAGVPVTFRP